MSMEIFSIQARYIESVSHLSNSISEHAWDSIEGNMPKANRYFSSILSKRYTAPQHQRMNIFGWHFLIYRCDKESDWKYSWVLRAVVPTRIAIFSGKWRDFYWMARELIWFDQKYSVNIVKLSFLAGGNNLGRASSRFRPQACSELLMLFSQENCHKNTARPFPTK